MVELSKAAGATFVARTTTYHVQQMADMIVQVDGNDTPLFFFIFPNQIFGGCFQVLFPNFSVLFIKDNFIHFFDRNRKQ